MERTGLGWTGPWYWNASYDASKTERTVDDSVGAGLDWTGLDEIGVDGRAWNWIAEK